MVSPIVMNIFQLLVQEGFRYKQSWHQSFLQIYFILLPFSALPYR
jgi:hypothetical protein